MVMKKLSRALILIGLFSASIAKSQDTLFVYPSMAEVAPTVNGSVALLGGLFDYTFVVSNGTSASQKIWMLMVRVDASIQSASAPASWDASRAFRSGATTVLWAAYDSSHFIIPGGVLAGFSFSSAGLPSVQTFYAIGRVEPPEGEFEIAPGTNDIFENSYQESTVGPRNPPTPFNGLNFLDTIKSYINESRTLGWITNQATADKYTRLIDTARAHLLVHNAGRTKAKLDSMMIHANIDSSSTLSSEAYALIYFNSKYVLEKLREQDDSLALLNKSSSTDATARNNARKIAKYPTGQSPTYLHEVFTSGGEIFYRRSTDSGESWDQTRRINSVVGENSQPCITSSSYGTVRVVWQRQIGPSTYEVWYCHSQNEGETWSEPVTLPQSDSVTVSSQQSEGPMPVVGEYKEKNIFAVFCSGSGLRYRTSDNDGEIWSVPQNEIIDGNDYVARPSMSQGPSTDDAFLTVVYDYAGSEKTPFSRTFTGAGWSAPEEVRPMKSITEGSWPSVAVDPDTHPLAVWNGTSDNLSCGRVIVFRLGYSDNTWSDWFTVFGQRFMDLLNPSVTYYDRNNEYGVAIAFHTSQGYVKLVRVDTMASPPTWTTTTLSQSGAWPSITKDDNASGTPIVAWTARDSVPYRVMVETPGGLSPLNRQGQTTTLTGVNWKRRVNIEHRKLDASLALEFDPIRMVVASGDTVAVPFKPASFNQRGTIILANAWDYLGTDTLNLPLNVRWLVVTKRVTSRGTAIGQRKYALRLLNSSGTEIAILDNSGNSSTISVDITAHAGSRIIVRPRLQVIGINPELLKVTAGDIFTLRDEGQPPLERNRR
jgi:hypothetical protein